MQMQSNTLNFEGQNIYAGIDVHKKNWTVSIVMDDLLLKTFSQAADAAVLHRYLTGNYPGATYHSAYEAGFCGFWPHYTNPLSKKSIIFAAKMSMKRLQIAPHFSDEALKTIVNSQAEVRAFKDWQIIYFVQTSPCKKLKEIALMLCVGRSKVLRIIKIYNRHGQNWRNCGQWGGRRESRCHMSLEDEKLPVKSLEIDALAGKILTFKNIGQHVERQAGKEVSDDCIWDLFSRHGRKKKVPRPYHPKMDKKAQEEYKKNSVKIWLPSH
jgi:transposase